MIKLNVAKVSNRGNKYAIIYGNVILRKFKCPEEAKLQLSTNRKFYEYWSESVSVSVDNSKKQFVIIS
ncbi:MAG: hypothetical protein ACPGSD_17305 [Flavobacteriales bacterium]|jgi:hypothetical protein